MGREARANQPTAESEIAPFLLVTPIAKVDKEQRLVTGIVTAEVLDKQGEIVDYECAKKFFLDPELWPGNMREMHQPKAVGKRITVECDDANKTISVTSRVSKGAPDTWEKILDGTLSMHSIGGGGKRVTEKNGTGTAKRLFLEQLAEVSYVDNGACPAAKFEIVKSVDGKITDAQPADPDEPVADPAATVDAALDAVIADTHKTASGADYAGVDGTSGLIADPKDVAVVARALARTDQDTAAVKANIIRIAYKLGTAYVAKLPELWKQPADQKAAAAAGVAKAGPEPYDIDGALAAISFVNRLMANEYWEARYASAGASDGQKQQIAMLKAACDALLAFLRAEYDEQFETDTAATGAITPLDLSDVLGDDAVEMFVKSLAVIQKAGARNSKSDQERIQKVHDITNDLGAACSKDMVPDDTEKVLTPAPAAAVDVPVVEKTVPTDDVKKITADLDATKALLSESQATVAKQAETVAALDERLKAIETLPAAGGPVRSAHAVDKGLGGPGTGTEGEPSLDATVKALQDLAASSTSPIVKAEAAKEILKLQTRTGSNHLALRPEP